MIYYYKNNREIKKIMDVNEPPILKLKLEWKPLLLGIILIVILDLIIQMYPLGSLIIASIIAGLLISSKESSFIYGLIFGPFSTILLFVFYIDPIVFYYINPEPIILTLAYQLFVSLVLSEIFVVGTSFIIFHLKKRNEEETNTNKNNNLNQDTENLKINTEYRIKYCPNCGVKLDEESNYCPNCGKQFNKN